MSETIGITIICHECNHINQFNVKGEYISVFGGHEIPLLTHEEDKKDRICEICGVVLK